MNYLISPHFNCNAVRPEEIIELSKLKDHTNVCRYFPTKLRVQIEKYTGRSKSESRKSSADARVSKLWAREKERH